MQVLDVNDVDPDPLSDLLNLIYKQSVYFSFTLAPYSTEKQWLAQFLYWQVELQKKLQSHILP